MQTIIETIISIPFYEIGELMKEEDYTRYSCKYPCVEIETKHEYQEKEEEVGILSDEVTYKSFRPLKQYEKPVLDAIEVFMNSSSSQVYHERALERYLEYIQYLQLGLI